MTRSLPKLPMNEGQYRLYNDEELILLFMTFQTFQKVVVTTIATDKNVNHSWAEVATLTVFPVQGRLLEWPHDSSLWKCSP